MSSDGTYNYLYDANGNMTKKTTISSGAYVTYTWDYRNRLTDVKAYNSSNVLQSHEHYVYDVFNRLIERQKKKGKEKRGRSSFRLTGIGRENGRHATTSCDEEWTPAKERRTITKQRAASPFFPFFLLFENDVAKYHREKMYEAINRYLDELMQKMYTG